MTKRSKRTKHRTHASAKYGPIHALIAPTTPAPIPLDPKAVTQASDSDRRWFAEHPGATERIRPIIPGEFGDTAIAKTATHTRTTEIAPGVRYREPVRLAIFAPGSDRMQ